MDEILKIITENFGQLSKHVIYGGYGLFTYKILKNGCVLYRNPSNQVGGTAHAMLVS